jgi:aconitate hydratase
MDARSIAASALAGGYLASAAALDWEEHIVPYHYGVAPYLSQVYTGVGKADTSAELRYGPNLTDWPPMDALGENLLINIVSRITDPVTTTDELIPSGETSSFRSNPLGLAEYTLSRKDPGYVARAKAVQAAASSLAAGESAAGKAGEALSELSGVLESLRRIEGMGAVSEKDLQLGSAVFAYKPGDGSAREQAASCQKVLGGCANFVREYATKRYRSNLINWGILPFIIAGDLENGDYVFIPAAASKIRAAAPTLDAWVISGKETRPLSLKAPELNPTEREIVLAGCLINYNKKQIGKK